VYAIYWTKDYAPLIAQSLVIPYSRLSKPVC